MGRRIVRLQRQRRRVSLRRFLGAAECQQCIAAIEMGAWQVGRQGNGCFVALQRLAVHSLILQQVALSDEACRFLLRKL